MFIVVGFQHIARVFLGLTIALIATQPQAAEPHGFTQRGGGSIGCYSRRDLRAALVTSVGVTPRLRAQHAVLMDEQLGLTYVRNLDPYGDISSRVSILDSTTGRLLHTVDTRIPASDVAVDAAQGHAFVVQEKDALNTVTDVTMFDARDGRLLRTVHLPPPLVLQRRLCKTAVFSGKSRPMSRLCWPSAPVIAAIRVSRSSTKAALRSYWKNPSL